MKIGFSLGRCVRDIVNGDVELDEVAFIITATSVTSVEQLDGVIQSYLYEPNYLLGYDQQECIDVARALWDTNRLLQPRRQGLHRHMQPENSLWVDMFPTALSENQSVKSAWDTYRFMLHMVENVETDALEAFKK